MDLLERRRLMMNRGKLPAGYTELTAITASGYSWIDTGVYGDNYTTVEYSFRMTSQPSGTSILGYYTNASQSLSVVVGTNGSTANTRYGTGSAYISWTPLNRDLTITMSPAGIKREGGINDMNYWSTSIFRTTGTLRVGHGNWQNGIYGNIYYCKIWSDGSLVRDFIPAREISTNRNGLYDLVRNSFYASRGSQAFGSL